MRSTQELTLSQTRKTPSFSSSLLDAIYRSIDEESNATTTDDFSIGSESKTKVVRKTQTSVTCKEDELEMSRHLRAIMIEKQMVIKTGKQLFNSASSSSDSSYRSEGTLFSPSETESTRRARSLQSCFTPIRTKQIRAQNSTQSHKQQSKQHPNPVSPGRRFSIILNSLFNANKKDTKKNRNIDDKKPKSTTTTTCSLASSLTRSVFSSKTQTSMPKPSIQQSKQCCENEGNFRNEITSSYQFDDDDDVESNASSDLFEIENLIGNGGKYIEELPVYGTTDLKTNQAIARGFTV